MQVINQNDYAHIPYPAPGYENATIKSGGCGVCSMLNVLLNITDRQASVESMAALAQKSGARVSGGTDMNVLMREVIKAYPELQCCSSNDIEAVRETLEKGGAAIVNADGRNKIFSTGGHYITVTGIDGDSVTVLDSGYYNGKYSVYGREKYVRVLGRGILESTLSALDKDSRERNPRFYLFENTGKETKEEESDMRYERLRDIPNGYGFRDIIEELMNRGVIAGDGSDPNGNDDIIDLSHDMVRMLVFLYRAGAFDR